MSQSQNASSTASAQNTTVSGSTTQNNTSTANTSSSGSASSSSTLNIPSSAPAGGLTITQPPQTATSFYKIAPSNTITFAWNFTDVLSTPSHLTVSAVCDNGNTYPVGPTDGVIPGTATSVTWDLWSYQQAHAATPLAQETYVLHIFDDRGEGAPRARITAGEHRTQVRDVLSPAVHPAPNLGWTCPTCNGSWSDFVAHPAFVSLVATFVIMFLSGYSILRRTWQ
ncbi:hypothetical protein A0H81_02280 [Grifola frondosa]|uniref:DUF7137 domain-containing protein n=1 Tax=Grifola frondosa TaxID=5627 RepID=A0A1C7MMP3_GRIFR|nr:hypothetical protein A0H81_02280 [Grifola frondosa]